MMQLQRIRVEQLRQFRQPFELAGLDPGLNLLAGPNEAGKSTLVRAIRAAFFERVRSTSMDDLLPWGEPSAAPSVESRMRCLVSQRSDSSSAPTRKIGRGRWAPAAPTWMRGCAPGIRLGERTVTCCCRTASIGGAIGGRSALSGSSTNPEASSRGASGSVSPLS